MIWRENGTAICICDAGRGVFKEKCIRFSFRDVDDDIREEDYLIYGKTDAAIVETAVFFWSLKDGDRDDDDDQDDNGSLLKIEKVVDFTAFQPEQLVQIFDANPMRHFEFEGETWSAEQSLVLAMRPYPLNIKLTWCRLNDDGMAFLDALEKQQQPSFGSFSITFDTADEMPFSRDNLMRLLKLGVASKSSNYPCWTTIVCFFRSPSRRIL